MGNISASAAVAVILLLLLARYPCSAVELPLSSPLQPVSCSTEIVLFSPCLPYVSLPPNNLSLTVPPHCCDAFSSSSISVVSCFCYLFRQPSMLGFPLNLTKLSGLPANCKAGDVELPASDLKSLCSDSPPMPPLQSSPGSMPQNFSTKGPSGAPSQLPDLPRDSTINSSLSPGFQSHQEASPAAHGLPTSSWAANQLNLLILCTTIFLVRSLML